MKLCNVIIKTFGLRYQTRLVILFGILTYAGLDDHIAQLHQLLLSGEFKEQENIFIDSMFDYYIRPFHASYIHVRLSIIIFYYISARTRVLGLCNLLFSSLVGKNRNNLPPSTTSGAVCYSYAPKRLVLLL